jgi:predicted nucleic acid-binding Zn ribbon protein
MNRQFPPDPGQPGLPGGGTARSHPQPSPTALPGTAPAGVRPPEAQPAESRRSGAPLAGARLPGTQPPRPQPSSARPNSAQPPGARAATPPGLPSGAEAATPPDAPPGTPSGAQPTGVDLARVALRAAREQARARGTAAEQRRQARRGGLRSGARADGRDPLPLGAAISRLITERGWEAPAAVGGVMGRWPDLVGPEVAQHCAPQGYDEDARVLTVRCDSTVWATQLRLLAPQLVARLNADLGPGTVKLIKVLGPGGPAPRYGPLRAPGGRRPGYG